MRKLTPKEAKFCDEYIIDLNATQAAIRAGYSEKTAGSIGHENLNKPEIQLHIKELQKDLSDRTKITQEMVINELAKIGFSDIKNYYQAGENQKSITTLEDKVSGAIKEIKITSFKTEHGISTTKEIKLHDKIAALDKLGRHLGVFEKDNHQKVINVNIVDVPDQE